MVRTTATDVAIEGHDVCSHVDEQQQQQHADAERHVRHRGWEELVVQRLQCLVTISQETLRQSVKMSRIAVAVFFLHHVTPVSVTFAMLLVSCFLYPRVESIACTVLFLVLYALCMALQVYLLWARVVERKMRTTFVMSMVLSRWRQRLAMMAGKQEQTPKERRAVFKELSAVLPAKAFRMVVVIDAVTGRLKHTLKSLLVRGSLRLAEVTLSTQRYLEPVGLCKLVDVMQMTLESGAVVLRQLHDKARPPRHPNLHIALGTVETEEQVDTTDGSDYEYDTQLRTELCSADTSSVPQKMEMLVHRIFLLMWVLGMLFSIVAGCFAYIFIGTPIGEGVFLHPATVLLGLLPVNAILLNRFLVLYANIYLDRLFHHLIVKPMHTLEDRIPRFSFFSTIQELQRAVWREPGHHSLCFSSSLVETLGMATVVALLDVTGLVTDMVPLPTHMLMLKCNEKPESDSSSSSTCGEDDDGVNGVHVDGSHVQGGVAATEQPRELKKQVRRKKFQERRFLELRLTPSQRDDLTVQFADEKEFNERQSNVNPVSLCLLLHALAPEPENIEVWTEPFRFCDRTLYWARSTHWVARASGFDDTVASTFRVLARVFQVDTRTRTGYRNDFPEQACTLVMEGEDGALHAFTVGTVYMVTRSCLFHFTGSSIEEFDEEARAELVHVGKMVWEEGMGLEVVATSHKVLPEQYHSCAAQLLRDGRKYTEFFFHNGVRVTESGNAAGYQSSKQQEQEQQSPANSGMANLAQSDDDWDNRCNPADIVASPRLSDKLFKSLENEENVSEKDKNSNAASVESFLELLVGSSHVFLGLVGIRDSIRPNVQNAMSVLDEAGIRCMYFCADSGRRTKSFGSRLGFETDWNCCISLKEGAVELDRHSIRAQLPVGIESIRRHILHVDSIPLQVKMFSHAHGASTRAMLSILQDNHEVVVAIGSVFNHSNTRSFIQSELSIGVLPTRRGPAAEKEEMRLQHHGRVVEPSDFNATGSLNRDLPLYRNVAELIACSCTLSAASTTSILPIVTTLIRQARMRLSGIGNCVEFIMHANVFITLVNVLALMLGAPLMISPTAAIFELNVIIPIFALVCTYTAYADMDSMKTIPSRHNYFVRLAIFRHGVLVWCLRYIPSLIALLVLGVTCGNKLCGRSVLYANLSSSDVCISSTRGYVALTLNYWLMIHSWTHISRHHPISPDLSFRTRYGKRSMYLFKSFRWVFTSVLATTLSVLFVLVTTHVGENASFFYPSHIHFFSALLFPFLLLLLDVPIKGWRARRFNIMQKFRRLSFGTRLGMHSPRGDYEPEMTTYPNSSGAADAGGTETSGDARRTPTLRQRLHDIFYRFTTMQGGKLELNCVCCDHIGGNYATYYGNANDT